MLETCYETLLNSADKQGFVVYYGQKIPMQKFLRDIEGFAASLAALQLNKGDVVTVYLPTCPQSLAAFYACSKLGLVANFVHPLIPLRLLKQNLQKVRSKVLMFYDALLRDEKPLQQLDQILVRCSVADYVGALKPFFALYAAAGAKRQKRLLTYSQMRKNTATTAVLGKGADVVCYMHSGGTSGEPKIVKLSNNAFNGTAQAMKQMYRPRVQKGEYNLATLPIFHAYGLCAAMHTPLCIGCSLILVPKFQPKTVKNYFAKYNVTIWSVVPAMLLKMEKAKCLDGKNLKNLDVIWCGGDVLDEKTVEKTDSLLSKYCKRAQLMRGYGLTEVCGVCAVNNFNHYQKGSCGQPMPTCFAQIWDDDGNVLPAGEIGEIAIYSPGNMDGYLEGQDCLVEKQGKRWVTTGDLGYLDEEGFLFVVDRKKRSLKIAAVNVFPSQVENCVKQLPFVEEACAVGVKVDGKQFVKVYVTLATPTDSQTVKDSVVKICQDNLIPYSVPQFVEVLSAMPRTPMGKIDFKSLEKNQ